MGTFRVQIDVGDPEGREYVPVEALVETGATWTALPSYLLHQLGVSPHTSAEFDMADGSAVKHDIGRTLERFDGRSDMVPVVFLEEGMIPLLGAVTLEIFLLAVDRVRQRLVPVRGLLMALEREARHPISRRPLTRECRGTVAK